MERVKSREVRINYFPSDDIIGDYLTKPLQGAKTRNFWEKILNDQLGENVFTPIYGANPQMCVREWVLEWVMSS